MTSVHPKFTALTFGRRIAALAPELRALGVAVETHDDPAAVLAAADSARELSVLVVSSDVGPSMAAAVLTAMRERYSALPIIWLGDELGGAPLGDFRCSPDALLQEPVSALAVHHTLLELLHRRHSETTAGLLVSTMTAALTDTFRTDSTPSPVFVNAMHRLVGQINSIVAFCGAGISGCMMISADESTLGHLYRHVVPDGPRAERREAEDLAGEIANLAAGKLKFAFDQLGVRCEIGTPLLVGTAGTILRRTHSQPSLVVEFSSGDGVVRGELTVDRCDDSELERLASAEELPTTEHDAELCFL